MWLMYLDVWKKRKLSATHNLISKIVASPIAIDMNLILINTAILY